MIYNRTGSVDTFKKNFHMMIIFSVEIELEQCLLIDMQEKRLSK
jgi:hypothetical protein